MPDRLIVPCWGTLVVALLASFALSTSLARAASLTWSNAIPLEGTANVNLNGISCPSASQCTAVNGTYFGLPDPGQEVTFNPAAPGTPSPTTIDSGQLLVGVACPSASQCTVLDDSGRELTFDPASPGTPAPMAVDPFGRRHLACASTTQCTVVDLGGREITFNPTAPGTPTAVTIDSDSYGREVTFKSDRAGQSDPQYDRQSQRFDRDRVPVDERMHRHRWRSRARGRPR